MKKVLICVLVCVLCVFVGCSSTTPVPPEQEIIPPIEEVPPVEQPAIIEQPKVEQKDELIKPDEIVVEEKNETTSLAVGKSVAKSVMTKCQQKISTSMNLSYADRRDFLYLIAVGDMSKVKNTTKYSEKTFSSFEQYVGCVNEK